MARSKRGGTRGFTLIEMVVVIAIMGILTSVALTSYRESVAKARRADAVAALMAGAQGLERYYSINGKYRNAVNELPGDAFPSKSPKDGATLYNIAVQGTPTDNTYVLRATRTGAMANDPCGNYQISETGEITMDGRANNKAEKDCLKR